MNLSNTRLTEAEKFELRDLREMQEDMIVVHNGYDTVIVAKNTGNVVKFATAVKSPDEKKFRRKVGEYLARMHFENSETVQFSVGEFNEFCHLMGYALKDGTEPAL